jgi:hypothetical protein
LPYPGQIFSVTYFKESGYMAFTGTYTDSGRAARALRYYSRPDLLFFFGRTTSWGTFSQDPQASAGIYYTDNNPPPADPVTAYSNLIEVVGYKAFTQIQMLVLDPNGAIAEPNGSGGVTYYSAVSPNTAIAQNANYLLFQAELVGEEVPLSTIRQYGIVSSIYGNPSAPGYSVGKVAFTPSQVTTYPNQPWGTPTGPTLEYYRNIAPLTRLSDRKQIFDIIMTF